MGQAFHGVLGSDSAAAEIESRSLTKRIGSFERIDTTRLSGEAAAFLAENQKGLRMHTIVLSFQSKGLEAQFMQAAAEERWPVLMAIFCFDVATYTIRVGARAFEEGLAAVPGILMSIAPQLCNMMVLYTAIYWINRRSRHTMGKIWTACQEELLLSLVVAMAISWLLLSLRKDSAQDYAFACFFLICTTSLLKVRWLLGTLALTLPLLLVYGLRLLRPAQGPSVLLPRDADVHLTVAWATGALMSFVADSYRRQMFANAQLARAAAEKEIEEARARTQAQQALADAQAQAAQRALVVAREKAANEAKSEFMSLMCHEVRTPLNGCLASAEMLLETPLGAEQRELAKTIRVSGSILLSTVSNFLDFFKLEAGKQLDVVRREIDVQELVEDVHCIIEAMIGRSSEVRLMRPQLLGIPYTLLGDPDRVRGILLNLYSNAAKFTKKGAISLKVFVAESEYKGPNTSEHMRLTQASELSPHITSPFGFGSLLSRVSDASAFGHSPQASTMFSQGAVVNHLQSALYMPTSNLSQSSSSGEGLTAAKMSGLVSSELPSVKESTTPPSTSTSASCLSEVPTEGRRWSNHDRQESSRASGEGLGSSKRLSTESSGRRDSGRLGQQRVSWDAILRNSFGHSLRTVEAAPDASTPQERPAASTNGTSEQASARTPQEYGASAKHRQQGDEADLGPVRCDANGWCSVTSSRTGQSATADPGGGGAAGNRGRWLVFEVSDTGCGVAREGLRSLFQEYVQGTEDEMRRPRGAGGTGLGLSICSKQVAVLGGKIGATSKPSVGSTFWFTVPLLEADPSDINTLEVRRTASWSTRDAFTDGHLAEVEKRPGLRTKAATSRAHAFRKLTALTIQRSSSDAQNNSTEFYDKVAGSHSSSPSEASATAWIVQAEDVAQRRKSAPDLPFTAAEAVAIARNARRKSLRVPATQPMTPDRTHVTGSPAGQMAEARALLHFSSLHGQSDTATAAFSADLRATLRDSLDRSKSLNSAAPGDPSASTSSHAPSAAADALQGRGCKLEHMQDLQTLLPSPSSHYDGSAGGGLAAGGAEPINKMEQQQPQPTSELVPASRFPSTSLPSQDVLDYSTQHAAFPGGSKDHYTGVAGRSGSSSNGPYSSMNSGGRKKMGMRPSMEMRCKKLDVSLLQGRRVLLAEDNLINQTVAKKMLTTLGLVCEVACNGQEAVTAAKRGASDGKPFDVILMDMAMPVMGGVEAAQVIRRMGFTLPIVAMTANASDRDRDECLDAGMDGFLSKPVLKNRLAEAITQVISGRARYKDNSVALAPLKAF